jgi:hypothetical protein
MSGGWSRYTRGSARAYREWNGCTGFLALVTAIPLVVIAIFTIVELFNG